MGHEAEVPFLDTTDIYNWTSNQEQHGCGCYVHVATSSQPLPAENEWESDWSFGIIQMEITLALYLHPEI